MEEPQAGISNGISIVVEALETKEVLVYMAPTSAQVIQGNCSA